MVVPTATLPPVTPLAPTSSLRTTPNRIKLLIPGSTNETGGGKRVDLLFSRLVSFDKDGKASNEVAESITPNDDATQYTIKIKSGWKFTDGTPVTAESFTKAWSYVANAKIAQKCSSFFSTIAGYDYSCTRMASRVTKNFSVSP